MPVQFSYLQPFVPSGKEFEKSLAFFIELGFTTLWQDNNYANLEKDGCRFFLQRFDNKPFAENFMLTVNIDDAKKFRNEVLEKELPEKYGIRIGEVCQMPYGIEVNIIDIAGVCWHFVQ